MSATAATVESLVQSALGAMEAYPENITDRDLLSACFTITLRCVQATLKRNENLRPTILQACQFLLIQCTNPTQH